jgi:hypothetical protein
VILATDGQPLALIELVIPLDHLARQKTPGAFVLAVCADEQFLSALDGRTQRWPSCSSAGNVA